MSDTVPAAQPPAATGEKSKAELRRERAAIQEEQRRQKGLKKEQEHKAKVCIFFNHFFIKKN